MEPKRFYRVQSDRSFTLYDATDGFKAQGHYHMGNSHWINKGKFQRHLDWSDRSDEPTPFISLFDNWRECSNGMYSLYSHPSLTAGSSR
jgi:hypothetical protein